METLFIKSDNYKTIQEMTIQIFFPTMFPLYAAAIKQGFYLQHWIHIVSVMIYKHFECIELQKLHMIYLFEADFNLIAGIIFGRSFQYYQFDNNLINPNQYRCSGGECMDAVIILCIDYNLACYT